MLGLLRLQHSRLRRRRAGPAPVHGLAAADGQAQEHRQLPSGADAEVH